MGISKTAFIIRLVLFPFALHCRALFLLLDDVSSFFSFPFTLRLFMMQKGEVEWYLFFFHLYIQYFSTIIFYFTETKKESKVKFFISLAFLYYYSKFGFVCTLFLYFFPFKSVSLLYKLYAIFMLLDEVYLFLDNHIEHEIEPVKYLLLLILLYHHGHIKFTE